MTVPGTVMLRKLRLLGLVDSSGDFGLFGGTDLVPFAAFDMIVDQTHRLHECIRSCWAEELPAPFL